MSLGTIYKKLGLVGVALLLAACGGSVDDGGSSAPPADTSGNSAGNTTSSAGSGAFTSSQLADCTPGFPFADASAAKPCRYLALANDQCYPTQDAACGCICPRNQASVLCVSGQDSWQSDTMFVSCE